MELGSERAKEIQQIKQRLEKIDVGSRVDTKPPQRYGRLYEQAALLSSFSADQVDVRSAAGRELIDDSVALAADDSVRYILDPSVRRSVLRQIGSRDRMQDLLADAESVPGDDVQQVINLIVNDRSLESDDASSSWLRTAFRVLNWFEDIIPTEQPSQLRAKIDELGFMARFEDLVGSNFQGREAELSLLQEYVGATLSGNVVVDWVRRGWTSFDEEPALLVTGPGGIGKSTLLAKFILDHAALDGARRLPYVYLNFDSPTIRANDPKTLLAEAVRQLAIQHPENDATIGPLRQAWRQEVTELKKLPDSRRRAREAKLNRRFRVELVQLLSNIDVADRPLLLVLDTFEVVQERQPDSMAGLFTFLAELQADHPPLRVVISGRAGVPDDRAAVAAGTLIRTRELALTGLDLSESSAYLSNAGLPPDHAAQIARHLTSLDSDDGASPLSLRVAVEIWRHDIERSGLDLRFWTGLRAGRIQAQLITRYLGHLDPGSKAGQLALPSMLLRRVTAAELEAIVAPAWDVPLEAGEAAQVLADLAVHISLLSEHGAGELQPRADVQRQITELLVDLEQQRVTTLHQLAVRHFAAISENQPSGSPARLQARLQEILHRLALPFDEQVVRARWEKGCADHLAIGDWPTDAAAKALLTHLCGGTLTERMKRDLSLDTWQFDTARRVRALLDRGNPETALKIFSERSDWNRAGPLSVLLVEALLATNSPLDASDAATAALEVNADQLQSGLGFDLNHLAAEAAYQLDRPLEALNYLEDAITIADNLRDSRRLAKSRLLKLLVQRGRNTTEAAMAADLLAGALRDETVQFDESELVRLMATVEDFPTLIRPAIRLGALDHLSSTDLRRVGRAITLVDEQVSATLDAEPGLLALSTGLHVTEESVTKTWQRALESDPHQRIAAVSAALSHDVPACGALLSTIATLLVLATSKVEASPPDISAKPSLRLNLRRRRELNEAVIQGFTLAELEDVIAADFDRSASAVAGLDGAHEYVFEAVISQAESEGWLGEFVIALRNRKPHLAQLFAMANELDLSVVHTPMKTVQGAAMPDDLEAVLSRLGVVEGQVGRLEIKGRPIGTGVLVGPDTLLVAAETLARFEQPGGLTDFLVRFGLKADGKGRVHDPGMVFAIAGPLDGSAKTNPAPYRLLRVDGYPGDEPLAEGREDTAFERRGFVTISNPAEIAEGQNAWVCAQANERLELRIERRAIRFESGLVTVPHLGDLASGAPCFDRHMRFVGLVAETTGDGRSRLLPGRELWQSINDDGFGHVVGVALS